MEDKKSPACPRCRSNNIIPIFYGYPSTRMMKKAEQGEILLGGCNVLKDSPELFCKDCENKWGVYKQFF